MSKVRKKNLVNPNNFAGKCMLSLTAIPELSSLSNLSTVKPGNITDVIQICDQHIFQQTSLVQNILNVCSDLTGISGCDKYCNKIITFSNKILEVTYQSTHSIIEICHSFSQHMNLHRSENRHPDEHSSSLQMNKLKTSEKRFEKVVQEEPIFIKKEIEEDLDTMIDVSVKNIEGSDSDEAIDVVENSDSSTQLSKRQIDENEDDQNDVCEENCKMGNSNIVYKQLMPSPNNDSEPEWQPDECGNVADPEWQPDTHSSDLKHKTKKLIKVKSKKFSSKNITDEEFPCIYCQLKLKSVEARSKHEAKHQCEICGRIFQIGQKKRHLLIHTGERNFVCDVCGSKFATNYRLQYHKINVHQVERPFPCDQCTYRAKSAELLRKHKKSHSNIKNYLCTDCGSCFKNLYDLKLHTVTHKDVWPFSCEACSKRFKTKDRLQRHEKIHKDSFSYQCTICGKKMHQSGNLKTHMRTHTGDKPYICLRCGKGFAHNVTRKQHEEVCFGSINMSASDSLSMS